MLSFYFESKNTGHFRKYNLLEKKPKLAGGEMNVRM